MKLIGVYIGMLLLTYSSAENDLDDINKNVGDLVNMDIRLKPDEYEGDFFEGTMSSAHFRHPYRAAVKIGDRLWDLPIPFVIDAGVGDVTRAAITFAMKEYGDKTCIRFKLKEPNDKDYIIFTSSQAGCWSYLGKTGGGQTVSLGTGCGINRIAVHEIMHALGFLHEQSRHDRDSHVTIHLENIIAGQERQFQKAQSEYYDNLGVPYDFKSVMHYKRKAFSRNNKDTITRNDGDLSEFGQPNAGGLSNHDAQRVNLLYPSCMPTGMGEWGSWSAYNACNAKCGGGTQVSRRVCKKAPCTGPTSRTQTCNTHRCRRRWCFPADAFVRNDKGSKILMKDLKHGEKVLTMDSNSRPVYSEIIMMLHRDVNQTVDDFVTIATQDGRYITLTSYHLIALSTSDFIFAKDVKLGQKISIFDEIQDSFKTVEVTSVESVTKTGLYAPLSMEGTLIVNDVYVSCYALFPSHSISHFVFSLWRSMYAHFDWLLSHRTDVDGVHWYPSSLLSAASYFNLVSS